MPIDQTRFLIILGVIAVGVILLCWLIIHAYFTRMMKGQRAQLERLRRENDRQAQTIATLSSSLSSAAQQISAMSDSMEARQDRLRQTVDAQLTELRRTNDMRLEDMRRTVDEKLTGTLEKRLNESFRTVSGQLERVYRGLGEMQNLAVGVGDLKKVLTNVKTRGVWGEIRLRALIADNLTPGQYIENAQVDPASRDRVEFAICLPGKSDGASVLLPVDSKFPQEDYLRLIEAAEAGDKPLYDKCAAALARAVTEQARKISEKYIRVPATTDFAILFLPTESLYAEVARIPGLMEDIQKKHRIVISGPATFAALLNSLQMGFTTVAIERRTGEVWALLGSIRTEFDRFGDTLSKARIKLQQAVGELDSVDTRTRAIHRRLRDISDTDPNA